MTGSNPAEPEPMSTPDPEPEPEPAPERVPAVEPDAEPLPGPWTWRAVASRRSVAPRLLVLAVVAALAPMLGPASPGSTAPATGSKIAAEVREVFDQRDVADFWIRFTDRADTSAARDAADWTVRGQRVVDTLAGTANDSQARVRRMLDAGGFDYQAFWVTNAILVRGGSMAAATDLAGLDDVAEIRAPQVYDKPEPIVADPATVAPAAVEWGIDNINADDVWDEFSARGEGIVVGNIDTGVQFDHPALAGSYRGNNGDGTFTHDYNWLDTAGACAGTPCDVDARSSHGTHTMGTMVGASATDRIGVAPGARWIAANGCATCSDVDLIEAAQWMLAPTDADGGNADPGRRPHIVNNSLGSRFPSNDPFMEDILSSWADAGIFGVWANGNVGPNCATSSAPGSRTINYSVGAYDIGNTIAGFSSRGAGQDGEVKPNISAPGVAVRSSQQGNGYGALSGTSMATPHVTGAVALLWSAAPALIGDIEGTRQLLDLSAIDTANDQCGGSAGDNNVYGEGRLDALALVRAGSTGGTGTLAGTVTDAATQEPVRGATVAVTGPVGRDTATAADGTYSAILLPGEYQVTVTAFGYQDATRTARVAAGAPTTIDIGLTARDSVPVSGSVVDGSGHGWPLYARITVLGAGIDAVFTDPYTGRYSLSLPSNSTHTLRVTAQYPGYRVTEDVVATGVGELEHDIEVPVDAESCTAPGYDWAVRGARSDFDEPAVPDGWTVLDNNGAGGTWAFDDPGNRGNRTGGSGGFAVFDGDYLPDFVEWSSDLITPVADLTGVAAPALDFNIDYKGTGNATGEIDLSLDGGDSWQNVWQHGSGGTRRQPVHIDLPQAAGAAQARIRFHYTTFNTGWWQLDDVVLGEEYCAPVRGGIVAGQVVDANTDAHLAGAKIVNDDVPAQTVSSAATPNDPGLADGFYWMFTPSSGGHPFTASRPGYQPDIRQVNVAPHWVTRADFTLRAGRLAVSPATVTGTQPLGATRTHRVTFTNQGTAPVDVTLREDGGSQEILSAPGAPAQRVEGTFSPGPDGGAAALLAAPTSSAPAALPWTPIANYPVPIMGNSMVTADDGTLYSVGGTTSGGRVENAMFGYDPDTGAWTSRAAMGRERDKPAAAYLNGKVYVVGGWWVNGVPVTTLEIYNPSSGSWSTGASVPAAFAASGVGVLGETMYVVGGCDYDVCGHDDVFAYSPGTDSWRAVADYPEPVSWTSCGGIGGKLYCAGGVRQASDGTVSTTANAYVYDPATDGWAPIATMPLDLWGSGHAAVNGRLLVSGGSVNGATAITNEGFGYDPGADAWSPIPNSNEAVYRGGSACGLYKVGGSAGGFNPIPRGEVLPGYRDCGSSAERPWLSADRTRFSLDAGESVEVTLTLDAAAETVDQPGTYTGRFTVENSSPYGVALDVTMIVNPPKQWGKIAGTVTGKLCDGSTVPLPGATMAIDTWAASYTLRTDQVGDYGLWLDKRNNPLSVIVALDGWRPQSRTVRIKAGVTTAADFTLSTTANCG